MAASEQDIREFRRILVEIGRSKLAKRSNLRRVALRFQRAVTALMHATRESSAGVYRSGGAIASQHGVGLATQFLRAFVVILRSGGTHKAFAQHQLYLSEHRRRRDREFLENQFCKALIRLAKQDGAPDLQLLRDKSLFAQRCRQAGLPSIPLLAEFAEGRSVAPKTDLPREDLISKPATGAFGQGVRLWQYDAANDLFEDHCSGQQFKPGELMQYLCDLSRADRIIVQRRIRNHPALLPLSADALCNIRIVTCRSPSGALEPCLS